MVTFKTNAVQEASSVGANANFNEVNATLCESRRFSKQVRGPAYVRVMQSVKAGQGAHDTYYRSLLNKEMDFMDKIEVVKESKDHVYRKAETHAYQHSKAVVSNTSAVAPWKVQWCEPSSVRGYMMRYGIDFYSPRLIHSSEQAYRNITNCVFFNDEEAGVNRRLKALSNFKMASRQQANDESGGIYITQKYAILKNPERREKFQSLLGKCLKSAKQGVSRKKYENEIDWIETLSDAIYEGNIDIVQLVLERSPISSTSLKHGKTPFQIAFIRACRIEAGKEGYLMSSQKKTSVECRFNKILSILEFKGYANFEQRIFHPDDCAIDWELPIHYSTRLGAYNKLKWILDLGCNVNGRNAVGETALMIACRVGCHKIIHLILEHGAIVENIDNKQKYTALHYATNSGDFLVTKLLVEVGVDKLLRGADGKNACDIAEEKGYTLCSEYLKKVRFKIA